MDFDRFKDQVNQRRLEALTKISATPIAALVWGPNPSTTSKTARCRKKLKEELGNHQVYACYSEELFDPSLKFSNLAQQVAQVDAFDIVFSIPDSPGSIAEIHDFALIPGISSKIITFLDNKWSAGYSNQSLIQRSSSLSTQVRFYDKKNLPHCIVEESINVIKILKESFFLLGRR